MIVHLGKISNGTIKLYCPVRIDRGLFVLKIRSRYLKTDLISQTKFNLSTISSPQSKTTNVGASTIMAPNSHSRNELKVSMEYSMNMRSIETSQEIMKGGVSPNDLMPSKLAFRGYEEGYSSGQSQQQPPKKNKRGNPFKLSRENIMKMKMNDEEKKIKWKICSNTITN